MRRKLLYVALGSVVAGCIAVGASNYLVLRSADPHITGAGNARRTTAIVPGAGLRKGRPGPVLADRLELALRLYQRGDVQHILVSGDNDGRGVDEVNPMRTWLVERGVPSDDIYLDHAGFRTLDTMERAATVFAVRDAIVCTQGFHLHRSVYLARRAGIDAVGIAADGRRWKAGASAHVRELAARFRAAIDATLGVQPRYYGPTIPVGTAPAKRTHDSRTS